jgi:hypothetical protein
MTVTEVDEALEENVRAGGEGRECFMIRTSAFPGVHLMLIDGTLQRIDVREGAVATDTGVRIGDPVQKVHDTYGKTVEVLPHKYEWESGAQYLTIYDREKAVAIRFNTAAGKIASFQAGRMEPVQYVEGCG